LHQFLVTQNHLIELLAQKGIHITDFYYCPHHPTKAKNTFKKECLCRKPNPGMLLKAMSDYNINPKLSYMIGDKWDDVLAGKNAKLTGILVKTGYTKKSLKNPPNSIKADLIAKDLLTAAKYIIS